MNDALIWLHEDALRATHPIFDAAPTGAHAVHVWDESYLRTANYSLKRLVFLYETLCELPIDLVRGDTLQALREHPATRIFIPASNNPFVKSVARQLKTEMEVSVIDDDPFVVMTQTYDFSRFFQYWKRASSSALEINGGRDAKGD